MYIYINIYARVKFVAINCPICINAPLARPVANRFEILSPFVYQRECKRPGVPDLNRKRTPTRRVISLRLARPCDSPSP